MVATLLGAYGQAREFLSRNMLASVCIVLGVSILLTGAAERDNWIPDVHHL
jgi:hypothetical protein